MHVHIRATGRQIEEQSPKTKKVKQKTENLKSNNKLLLFINIKIIQLLQLFIQNLKEPILQVNQRTLTRLAAVTNGFKRRRIGGIVKGNRLLKGRKNKIKRIVGGYWINGRREIRVVFDELFEGFVTQKLVPPLGKRLLQMGFEFLPKFHSTNLERLELTMRKKWKGGNE